MKVDWFLAKLIQMRLKEAGNWGCLIIRRQNEFCTPVALYFAYLRKLQIKTAEVFETSAVFSASLETLLLVHLVA